MMLHRISLEVIRKISLWRERRIGPCLDNKLSIMEWVAQIFRTSKRWLRCAMLQLRKDLLNPWEWYKTKEGTLQVAGPMVNFLLHFSSRWRRMAKMGNSIVKITLTFAKYLKETEDHLQVEPLVHHQVNSRGMVDSLEEFNLSA